MHAPSWTNLTFLTASIIGALLALFSPNWLLMYTGMELNMFAFIPLMLSPASSKSHESAIKYFLAQIFGSILLFFGTLCLFTPLTPLMPKWFMLFGLLTKAGAPPAHQWFPAAMSGLTWPMCFLLSTWQKLFPLLFLFTMLSSPQTPTLMIFSAGALIGAIGGLSQTSARGLLAYSSISHVGWMLSVSVFSLTATTIYLMVYLSTTALVMFTFSTMKSHPMTSMVSASLSPQSKTALIISLLSLAGVPPLLGFLPKWQALETLSFIAPWAAAALLLASMTSLFFYLKIIFLLTMSPHTPTLAAPILPLFLVFLFFFISNLFFLLPLL